MKIALAQLNYHIGNFKFNTEKIINAIKKAKNDGCDLVVFSELSVCGYPPLDFLEYDYFIDECLNYTQLIAKECVDIAAIVGLPTRNNNPKGKPLFNSAAFLYQGKIQSIHNKSLLPNYDIFDEYRYFEPCLSSNIIEFKNHRLALTICEELWNIGEESLYPYSPMEELVKFKPDFIINISASPFHYEHIDERKKILKQNVSKYNIPLFYVNQVGANTELIFDGGSLVINKYADICEELDYFKEEIRVVDTNKLVKPTIKPYKSKPEFIYDALILGIKDYFVKMGLQKAIIGLSGGIDSALVLVLAVDALGKENVKAILLPSQFSSSHSVDDAVALASNLEVSYEIINIESYYNAFLSGLTDFFKGTSFDITEENLQARIRAVILMAFSNKFGYVLLNTSNKSEAAVGYGTLYGDMCGGLSVIGDLYKTQVYEIANFINRIKPIIPQNIIDKAPSAELRPNQKDSDSLPEYEILDKILYNYIELKKGPEELINLGFEKKVVSKTLSLVNNSEYKRKQTPPILRVSSKAFGLGRRMPIAGKYI
jgi:NAD+ synthase (glutamine-hydrolysing)